MGRLVAVLLWLSLSAPAWSDARITVLMDVMQLPEVIDILHDEGLAYGASLDADMLNGQGGTFWNAQVRRLYDRQNMQDYLRRALREQLEPDDVDAAVAFFASDAGTRVVESENSTRRAMADPDIQQAAQGLYEEMAAQGAPLVSQVARYIDVNDLIEHNVSGAMTEQFHFLKGMSDGGFYVSTEAELLEEVWAMRSDIQTDTEDWLNAFLVLAYEPLDPADVEAFVAFADSDAGRALNAALFSGFERVYNDIAYGLGRAVALTATGDEI